VCGCRGRGTGAGTVCVDAAESLWRIPSVHATDVPPIYSADLYATDLYAADLPHVHAADVYAADLSSVHAANLYHADVHAADLHAAQALQQHLGPEAAAVRHGTVEQLRCAAAAQLLHAKHAGHAADV